MKNRPVISLEMQAAQEILRKATAYLFSRQYPTLISTPKKMDKMFTEQVVRKGRIAEMLRLCESFFRTGDLWSSEETILPRAAYHLAVNDDKEVRHLVRVYAALCEAYNLVAHPLCFFSSREWPSPWEQWRYYLPDPIFESELAFVEVCALLGNIEWGNLYHSMIGESRHVVLSTVQKIADGMATESEDLRSQLSQASDIRSVYAALRLRYTPLPDRKLQDFTIRMKFFVATGIVMWRRTRLGYTLCGEGGEEKGESYNR